MDNHKVVGLAKLLVKGGLFTKEQVVAAMNISFTEYENGGWPIESSRQQTMTRAEFDEQVDFLWHALDREDVDLLARRLKYIFDKHGLIVEE